MLANCVSGSRMVAGFVLISREMGNPRISEPRIRNTSLTSLHRRESSLKKLAGKQSIIETSGKAVYGNLQDLRKAAQQNWRENSLWKLAGFKESSQRNWREISLQKQNLRKVDQKNWRENSLWKRAGKQSMETGGKAGSFKSQRNDFETKRHTLLAHRKETTHSSGAQKRNDTLFWRTEK